MKVLNKFKLNFVLIPLCVISIAWLGNYLTMSGIEWYHAKLRLPEVTPPGCVFSLVWKAIYVLTAIVALYIYNDRRFKSIKNKALMLLIINGLSVVSWNYLFFYKRALGLSVIDAGITLVTVGLLIKLIYPRSAGVALLLAPYFLWMLFAVYLDGVIWFLNRSL
jgi:benzodiazapine receptor